MIIIQEESIKLVGRIATGAYYDYQKVRMALMNRVRDIIRKRNEDIPFDAVESKEEVKKYASKYADEKLIPILNDLYNNNRITLKEYEYIKKCLEITNESKKAEGKYADMMKGFVGQEPVYNEFLSKIKGIGPVISANLIKEFGDCRVSIYRKIIDPEDKNESWILVAKEGDENFKMAYVEATQNIDPKLYKIKGYYNVSKLWAHTGNNVLDNGKAPRIRRGEMASFSPKLRAMTWKISKWLVLQNKGFYRKLYDTEKEKQLNRVYEPGYLKEKYGGKSYKKETDIHLVQGHAHNRAMRKIRKIFLDHYWQASRELNGLSVKKNYVEGILHHTNIVTWKDAIRLEDSIKSELI